MQVIAEPHALAGSSIGAEVNEKTASFSRAEIVTYSQETERERKTRVLLFSFILSWAICLSSLTLTVMEAAGIVSLAHPLFWLIIAVGSFGVAGSNLLYLKRIWMS